ncbi:hypothetical protein [Micromonospora sp. WMMA1976]|uniref:hypothetical protein n=1 Tax=Micromonospora sp. WMMA1976 TaxID=3014995 RepID=UPI00248CA1AD|nr:hypothetical protein [Micromonospora sp. WMMA1976]WBC06233.1 hypothetical protein O7546_15080 [Micromonospora sp. WMMA1976]
MTRPDEPTEALPTRALPITGEADAAEPTVHLAAIPGGDDRTADLAASATPTPPDAEPTVHLRPGRADDAGEATVHLPAASDSGAGQATVYPRPSAETAQRPGAEPTAAWQPTASWQPTGVPHHCHTTGTAATGAGAYPDRSGHTRAASGVPAPGGELRFGPGVPATPPPAPPWPTAPPIRRRPVWRRVVSVLSTLLTVVLLLTVGLYLWQRLRPLEVEGVTVAVPRPAGVACDVTVDVVATVRTNGRGGTIRYQWFRSDAPPGAVLTERVGSGQHTTALTLKWTFTGVGTTTGIATVNIIEPTTAQAGTRVVYRCPGG